MIITKMALPRRTFLRGIGATWRCRCSTRWCRRSRRWRPPARKPARRLGFVYVPNGVIQDQWVPATVGRGFELSPTLSPLATVQRQAARAERPGAAPGRVVRRRQRRSRARHARLAERRPPEADRRRRRPGRHDDRSDRRQRARQETPLPSLELALESQERSLGSCDNGYACVYINTISWRTPTTPLPMEIHPRVVFERLFGDGGNAAAAAGAGAQDATASSTRSSRKRRGCSSARRRRSHARSTSTSTRCARSSSGFSAPSSRPASSSLDAAGAARPTSPRASTSTCKLMFDLQVLAFQADITRVTSLLIGREQSGRSFPEIGVAEPHHSLSHHRDDPALDRQEGEDRRVPRAAVLRTSSRS